MDKKTMEKASRALERQERQFRRQNNYIRENYDRISVTLPKGTKEKILSFSESVNGYLNKLVAEDLEKRNI